MSKKSPDLHGNVPNNSMVALLLIDVINWNFEGVELLEEHARPAAKKIASLKQLANRPGFPQSM